MTTRKRSSKVTTKKDVTSILIQQKPVTIQQVSSKYEEDRHVALGGVLLSIVVVAALYGIFIGNTIAQGIFGIIVVMFLLLAFNHRMAVMEFLGMKAQWK